MFSCCFNHGSSCCQFLTSCDQNNYLYCLLETDILQNPHILLSEAWHALDHIYGTVFETPVEPSPWLAQQSDGARVLLKLELHQATGSFKARGAAHKILSLPSEKYNREILTSSTGNHALAILHACQVANYRKQGISKFSFRQMLPGENTRVIS